MGQPFTADPLLVVEREIRLSPHFSRATKSHLKLWTRALKKGLGEEPRQRAVARTAVSLYAQIASMDERAHSGEPLNGDASAHYAEYIRLSGHLAKLLRMLRLTDAKQGNAKSGNAGTIFTPPRGPRKREAEAEKLDGEPSE